VLLRPCRVRRPKLTPSRELPMSPSLVPGERQTKPHLVGLFAARRASSAR
jgi:hypothetical protein